MGGAEPGGARRARGRAPDDPRGAEAGVMRNFPDSDFDLSGLDATRSRSAPCSTPRPRWPARLLGISESHLYGLKRSGKFGPAPAQFGAMPPLPGGRTGGLARCGMPEPRALAGKKREQAMTTTLGKLASKHVNCQALQTPSGTVVRPISLRPEPDTLTVAVAPMRGPPNGITVGGCICAATEAAEAGGGHKLFWPFGPDRTPSRKFSQPSF